MRAIVYDHFQGLLSIRRVSDPELTSTSAIIKVKASGLCRSDWHGWMGHDKDIKLPHVPGHEFAGVISEIGNEVKGFKIGERVTVPFVCGCGYCVQCTSGNHQVCDHQTQPGFTHWGSFAEYVSIEYANTNLVRLPEEIDFTEAASLGCRFVTAYRAIVDQAKLASGQFIVIHGCGGVGLSSIMIAKALGAKVIAVDINNKSLSLAKKLGAEVIINPLELDRHLEQIKDITKGGAHVSIDALGSQTTCFNSIANLRKRGRHIQLGLMTADHQHPKIPMDLVIANELEILGSHGMQAYKYAEMFKLIADKKIKLNKLIHRTISLEDAITALPNMNEFKNPGISVITSF